VAGSTSAERRAPSLYKRFADRDAILVAVTEGVLLDLRAALVAAAPGKSPAGDLAEMARAYRAFARRFPRLYPLLFASGADVDARAAAVEPVLARLSALVAPKRVLPAARLLTAFLHGFVSMELGGAFRLGGSVDEAFAFGLETILGALVSSAR
jgi:AcrR family transcriptional regulator